MFQRVLVPTDLTDSTHSALALAVDLARRRFGSQITVLHAIARIPNLPDRELRDFYERLEHVARGRITNLLADIAGTDDVQITHRVVMGNPAARRGRVAAGQRQLQGQCDGTVLGAAAEDYALTGGHHV